jgi:hypothetical protein
MGKEGRPTKYKPEYCEDIIEYFSVVPYEEKTKTIVPKNGEPYDILVDEASDFPSYEGFAAKIEVHRETLLNWCEEHPKFFDAYKRCKALQRNWSLVNGHKGTCNTTFAIFAAKNLYGYTNGNQPEVVVNNNSNYSNMTKEQLEKELEKLEADES